MLISSGGASATQSVRGVRRCRQLRRRTREIAGPTMMGRCAGDGADASAYRQVERKYKRKAVAQSSAGRRRAARHPGDPPADPYGDVVDLGRHVPHRARYHVDRVEGHPGLHIIVNAVPVDEQIHWAQAAMSRYADSPYTNLSCEPNPKQLTRPALFDRLRWANLGRHYDWTNRSYLDVDNLGELPVELVDLYDRVLADAGIPCSGRAQAAIVNFYPAGTRMGGHVDDAEGDMESPIVSLSLGCSCIYLQGGPSRDQRPTPFWLRSGDIVIMSGPARRCYHGVALVASGTLPDDVRSAAPDNVVDYLSNARININLRCVDASQKCTTRTGSP